MFSGNVNLNKKSPSLGLGDERGKRGRGAFSDKCQKSR